MHSYLVGLEAKFWSEPTSMSLLCVCKQQSLGSLAGESWLLNDAIGTKIVCANPNV